MSPTSKRRWWFGVAGAALGLALAAIGLRVWLVSLAIGAALRNAGASEISFAVTRASLSRVVIEDVGFLMGLQRFAAGRVMLDRSHWWSLSLGAIHVDQAHVPVDVGSLSQAPGEATGNSDAPAIPPRLPFEEISFDGKIAIHAGGQGGEELSMRLNGQRGRQDVWTATLQTTGPGLEVAGTIQADLPAQAGTFEVSQFSLDLKTWGEFLLQLVPSQPAVGEVGGNLTGVAKGRFDKEGVAGSGRLSLRQGRVTYPEKRVVAEGVEADLEITDFEAMKTGPGSLRAREVRVGDLILADVRAEAALDGLDLIAVSQLSLRALGGQLSAEPFRFSASADELQAVVLAEGISVEEVMALTQDLPAVASGRVNGRLPVRFAGGDVQFGTGWLELQPGSVAEIQFKAKGLLTGGSAPGGPGFAVLEKIESGLLRLKISELRLDVRPPRAPEGRSAQLHLKGEPVDPQVKAPVTLDLNVNGPIEKLLSLGMNSRISLGAGK